MIALAAVLVFVSGVFSFGTGVLWFRLFRRLRVDAVAVPAACRRTPSDLPVSPRLGVREGAIP